MIYALVGSNVAVSDREAIARAINTLNAAVLAQYAGQGTIRHILDLERGNEGAGADPEDWIFALIQGGGGAAGEFYCIWCLDRVSPTRAGGPHGYTVAEPWYFRHATNKLCIGQPHRIGGGVYLNPPYQGCYVAMGCEQAPQRSRRQCRCISAGVRTYCQHASNPPRPGGPCLRVGGRG